MLVIVLILIIAIVLLISISKVSGRHATDDRRGRNAADDRILNRLLQRRRPRP